MEKEFVPYELAVKIKELGFDEPCFGYYDGNHNFNYMFEGKPENFSYKKFPLGHSVGWKSAPTFSQAFRWFREKYKLTSAVLPFQDIEDDVKLCYYYCVVDLIEAENEDILCNESSLGASDANFSSNEEAELACLDKLLEIVESEK